MKNFYISSLIVAAVMFCVGMAKAEEPTVHEGFQFRGALGAGYMLDAESPGSVSAHGGAGSAEVYVGHSLVPGLFLGGVIGDVVAVGPSITVGGETFNTTNDVHLNLFTIGPYVDWYPNSNYGLHTMATVGLADLNVSVNGVSSPAAVGLGLGLGVGYDWRVSRNWSLGVMGRFTYAAMQYNDGTTWHENTVAPTILFSGSFH